MTPPKGLRTVSVYTNRRGKVGVTIMVSEEFARALAEDNLEALQALTVRVAAALEAHDAKTTG